MSIVIVLPLGTPIQRPLAAPSLQSDAVWLSLAFVIVLTVVNLRGIRESGRAFAIPTYGFVAAVYVMLAFGFAKVLFGDGVTAESAQLELHQVAKTGGLLTVFLALRAFASGCTALTGVEAISNGVPAFRPPKSRNAALTLVGMGVLATTMFAGITALALLAHVHMQEGATQRTALSQVALASFRSQFNFNVTAIARNGDQLYIGTDNGLVRASERSLP